MTWLEHTHRVSHHQQSSVNSCWWACTAMLMRYRGHVPLRSRPENLYPIFRETPPDDSRSMQQLQIATPFGWYTNRGLTTRWREEQQHFVNLGFAQGFLHPAHWWRFGCPRDTSHTELWTRLTPLRRAQGLRIGGASGVSAGGALSEAGAANAQRWWDALEQKPLLVTQPRGTSFHALIARGIRRRRNEDVGAAQVILQDPSYRDDRHVPRSLLTVMRNTFLVLTI